jgi:spoIIIJ-associated protein
LARCRLAIGEGNYERTEAVIEALLAEKAKQTGLDQQVGPLNPYERRLVHLAVAEVPGVASESVGDAFSKTVLISLRK